MTGVEALKALIEGHSIRLKYWTFGNRLTRFYDERMGDWFIAVQGTALFKQDVALSGATWLVEELARPGDAWEIWDNTLEIEYQLDMLRRG